MKNYISIYQNSLTDKETFWEGEAKKISWQQFPQTILSQNEQGFYRWFKDGCTNIAYECLDKQILLGRGEQDALIYDSPSTNTKQRFSFNGLKEKVAKFGNGLKKLGIQKGDTVVIYMPMLPEAVVAMLACARIGAIHSVVFGGFAPHELAMRIEDVEAKAIISASYGIEVDKKIFYKPLMDAAIAESAIKPTIKIFHRREGDENDYDDVIEFNNVYSTEEAACEMLQSTDPLYVLYTSGTTGKPKGIVRDHGGYAVALKLSMGHIYGIEPGQVFWAASDVGWVVGHSFIVYGPLLNGNTTILYEGKPVKTPDAGAFWRVIEEYKVTALFTAPTAIRAIRKEDSDGSMVKQYDISTLKYLYLAGERCDPPTFHWIKYLLNIPVIDHWWQTESGWPMLGIMMGVEHLPVKAGSAGLPICGYDIRILNEEGDEMEPLKEGIVAIKLPLPPGCLPTLWKNDERFVAGYLSQFPGYYLTGDGGYKDEEGYCYIMGRIDDVINVSGHRLSTGEMEELVASHPAVAECCVVGIEDGLRGQIPISLLVLKDSANIGEKDLETELVKLIREKIGAIACFKNALVVKRLPKTRSGKILRKTIRSIADGQHFVVPSTIDDPVILEEIKENLLQHSIGNFCKVG